VEDELPTFRHWFAEQIAKRDWGVAEAAREIGIGHAQVSRYLAGLSLPERKAIKAIAAAFDVSREYVETLVDAGRPTSTKSDPRGYANGQQAATVRGADPDVVLQAFGQALAQRLSPQALREIADIMEKEERE
jgi:transcriptional regulator with XRE-family HTH domain